MTKYARDEFDKVPEASTRQGVHRILSVAPRRGLGPILAVGCAALVVGLVAFLILPKLGFGSAGEVSAVAAETSNASASPVPDASTPAAPTPSPSPTGEASVPSPSPSASARETAADVPAVDMTQPVTIFNGTTTAGLANRVGGTVASAGWTVGSLGNWAGARQQSSVIFYNDAAQKPNAEALGVLLGIPATVQSTDFQVPLVVVLGPDFR